MVPERDDLDKESREYVRRRLRDSRTTTPSCGVVHSCTGILGITYIPCPGHDVKRSN